MPFAGGASQRNNITVTDFYAEILFSGTYKPVEQWQIENKKPPAKRRNASAVFTVKEMEEATCSFSDENLLGKGGFGRVYKGTLKSGEIVAIKKMELPPFKAAEGEREFRVEVDILSRLDHPNLVKLIGYCTDGKQRFLVYEYMHKGNLQDHLNGIIQVKMEYWPLRLKVAIGAARGLAYLHSSSDVGIPIIHRDFKSTNILLDDDYEAKAESMADLETGETAAPTAQYRWWQPDQRKEPRPLTRQFWFVVSNLSWFLHIPYCSGIFIKFNKKVYDLTPVTIHGIFLLFIAAQIYLLLYFAVWAGYLYVMQVVYYNRESLPHVLRHYEKQLFESAFVVVSSCWCFFRRDDVDTSTTILGLILLFNVIPIMNLWWYFVNIGFLDCVLIVLTDAAVYNCRGDGAHVAAVAGASVALQVMKNSCFRYWSQRVKHSTEKHLI